MTGIWNEIANNDNQDPHSIRPGLFLIQFISEDSNDCIFTDPFWNEFLSISFNSHELDRIKQSVTDSISFTDHCFSEHSDILTLYSLSFSKVGILLIHARTDSIQDYISDLSLKLFLLCIAAFFVFCIFSCFIAKKVISPFLQMNHTVQCYSKGDFSQRLPANGTDEAAQLAKNFNEMAEQLRNMEETRKSFVANVSHELRSPLTSIKGFLEAMKDGIIPTEEHEAYLDIVLSETKRMNLMVNDLLDLARIESGIITLTYETFDINELIRRTLITFDTRLSEKKIELDIRFSSDNCFVYADSGQISQVLRNLIDNAIKYSGDEKILTISTYTLKKEVFVSIKDNGVGIPAEDVPHVFDRFYKVEKAHTPSPQIGSGLGLSIVKKIIEAHGQSITVKSGRGRGTQFTFTLQKAAPVRISGRGNKI